MGVETFRSKTTAFFAAGWALVHPTIPVAYSNVKFAQPKDGPWVNFGIVFGDRIRINVGTTRFHRQMGILNIGCFVPEDTGTKLAYEMADTVVSTFENVQIILVTPQSATFQNSETRDRGVVSGYYAVNVQLEFYYDERITA